MSAELSMRWKRTPLVATERQAQVAIGVLTLLIGISVLVMMPSQELGGLASGGVLVVALSVIPVALAWWIGPWPSDGLIVGFVVYADAGIIVVLAAFQANVLAMPLGALLCLVAVFVAIVGTGRLLGAHLVVSLCAAIAMGVLAVRQGNDAWPVASRTVVLVILFGVPIVLHAYVGRLRARTIEALLDPVTGLWNRRGLFEALDARGCAEAGDGRVVGVIAIDVTGAEQVDDQCGRAPADDALRDIAHRLLQASGDAAVARTGHSGFVCAYCGSPASVANTEQRVRAAIADRLRGGAPFVASIGVATDALMDGQTVSNVVQHLIAVATAETYRIKARTLADTQFACPSADPATGDLATIRERVDALIESGGPTIVFQPVTMAGSGEIVGYEALSRFPDASGSPLKWFRDATIAGVADRLELAAIDNALVAMRYLPSTAFVSLNTSAETVRTSDLLKRLTPHLDSRQLYLELTEHQRVDDFAPIAPIVAELRCAGVKLAIDDVGAGFASLMPVVTLRPDVLKTDNNLTQGIDADPVRRAAAAAIAAFAHEIGAAMLMEGVETSAEQAVAVDVGADLVQGFLHGRPVAAELLAGV